VSVTLDTGALIAVDRGDERLRALLDRVVASGGSAFVPAGVVAQAWRSARQVRLARILNARGTQIVVLDGQRARAVGLLCAASGTHDVVDSSVALTAREQHTPVVTSDPTDLRRLDPSLVIFRV
jgi:cell division ATPase FtsA